MQTLTPHLFLDAVGSPIAVASDAESSSSSSSSSSSDSSSVAVVAEPVDVAALAMCPEIVLIGACVIRLDDYVDLIRPSRSHVRYQISCLEHGHRCKKRRGVGAAHERRHGRAEPIAFCLAWAPNLAAFATGAEHIRFVPTDADIKSALDVLNEHGAI